MKALTEASTPTWRAPPAAASPWGRRPASLWALIVESWRETIDVYARTGGCRLRWGLFW
jgi:hypothetical protein